MARNRAKVKRKSVSIPSGNIPLTGANTMKLPSAATHGRASTSSTAASSSGHRGSNVAAATPAAVIESSPPRRPSVFERLGPGSATLNTSSRKTAASSTVTANREPREKCRQFQRSGSCQYGNACRYDHHIVSSSSTTKVGKKKDMNDDLRSKVESRKVEQEIEHKEERSQSSLSKRQRSRSRSSKREPENKIRSQVVVTTRKTTGRDEDSRNASGGQPIAEGWEGDNNGEKWKADRSQLDFEEELTLEKKRQQLQRELELEMRKEQRQQKLTVGGKVAAKKRAPLRPKRSSSSSSVSSTTSSSSSSSSSSSTTSTSSSSSSSSSSRSSSSCRSVKKAAKKKRTSSKKRAASVSDSSVEVQIVSKHTGKAKASRKSDHVLKTAHAHHHGHKAAQETKAAVSMLARESTKVQKASSGATIVRTRQAPTQEKIDEKHHKKQRPSNSANIQREQSVKQLQKAAAHASEAPRIVREVHPKLVPKKKPPTTPPTTPHKARKKQKIPKTPPIVPPLPPVSEVRRPPPPPPPIAESSSSSIGRRRSPSSPHQSRTQSSSSSTDRGKSAHISMLHPAYLAEHERRMAKIRPPSPPPPPPQPPPPPPESHRQRRAGVSRLEKGGQKTGHSSKTTASAPARASLEDASHLSRSSRSKDLGRTSSQGLQADRSYERQIFESIQSALETNRRDIDHPRHPLASNSPTTADRSSRSSLNEYYGQRGASSERSRESRSYFLTSDGKTHQSSNKNAQGTRKSKYNDRSKMHDEPKHSSSDGDRSRDAGRRPSDPPFDERLSRRDVTSSHRMHGDERRSLLSSHSSRSPLPRGPSSERGPRLRPATRDPLDPPRDRHGHIIEPLSSRMDGGSRRPRTPEPRGGGYARTGSPPHVVSPDAHRYSHQAAQSRYHRSPPSDWPLDNNSGSNRGLIKGQSQYSDDRRRGLPPSPPRREDQFGSSRHYDDHRQMEIIVDCGHRDVRGGDLSESLDRDQRRGNFPPCGPPGRSVMDTYERAPPRPRSDFVLDNRRSDPRGLPERWADSRDERLPDATLRESEKRRDDDATSNSRKRVRNEPAERQQPIAKRRCPSQPPAPLTESTQKPRDTVTDKRPIKAAPAVTSKTVTKTAPLKTVPREKSAQQTSTSKNLKPKEAPKGSTTKPPVTKFGASAAPAASTKTLPVRRRINPERKDSAPKVAQPLPTKSSDPVKRKRPASPTSDYRASKQLKPTPKTDVKAKRSVPPTPKPLMSISAKPPLRKAGLKPLRGETKSVPADPKSEHSDPKTTHKDENIVLADSKSVQIDTKSIQDNEPDAHVHSEQTKSVDETSKPVANELKVVLDETKPVIDEEIKKIIDESKTIQDETIQDKDKLKSALTDAKAEVSEDDIPKNVEDQHVIDCAGSFSDWSDDSQDLLNKDVEEAEKAENAPSAKPEAEADADKPSVCLTKPDVLAPAEPSEKPSIAKTTVAEGSDAKLGVKVTVDDVVVKTVTKSVDVEAPSKVASRSPIPPHRVERIKEDSRRSVSSERSVHNKRKSRCDGVDDSRSNRDRDNRSYDGRDRDRTRESTSGRSSRPSSRHTSLERGHRTHHESDRERSSALFAVNNEIDDRASTKEMTAPVQEERMKLPDMGEGVVIDSVGPDPGDKVSDLEGYEYDPISDDELDAMMDDTDDSRAAAKGAVATGEPQKPGIVDALEVDWASLVAENHSLPRKEPNKQHGSILDSFSPACVLARIGVSVAYAGTALLNRIEEHMTTATNTTASEKDVKDVNGDESSIQIANDVPRFKFSHNVAAIHAASRLQKQELETILDNVGSHRRALSARHDLHVRKRLCQLNHKKLESLPFFTTQNIDCELLRHSIQIFKGRLPQATS